MIAIIGGHFFGQSGYINYMPKDSLNYFLLVMFSSGQKVAVNVFTMISCWFLIDRKFDSQKVLIIYAEVLFYTVTITFGVLLNGNEFELKEVLRCFFPLIGRPLWYASAYIMLLLFSPFLRHILSWDKQSIEKLLMVTFLALCVIPTFAKEVDDFVVSLFWFLFIFLLLGYIKRTSLHLSGDCKILVFIGVLGYFLLAAVRAISSIYREDGTIFHLLYYFSDRFLHDCKSIPNLLISLCIFFGVLSLKESHSRIINYLSSGSFAVYVIHQTPAFINVLWHDILKCEFYMNSKFVLFYFIFVLLFVYFAFSFIDFIRRKYIEPVFVKSNVFSACCSLLNSFYNFNF